MPPQISHLRVGQSIGSIPPSEGLMPVINGPSFDIIALYSGLSTREVKDWQDGRLRYGVFVQEGIPFLLLDLGKVWELDISLNMFGESRESRRAFFEGDPETTEVHLVLASYPSVVILAKRTVRLDPEDMRRIKEACLTQLSAYPSAQACRRVIDRISAAYDSTAMRKRAGM